MSGNEDRVTMYSDYVCPFCYLGRRSLETYRVSRDRVLDVEWHPFDLRHHKRGPDGEIDRSVEDGKDEAYFERARRNVTRLQDEYGADEMLDPADVPRDVDSFDAQIASLHVQSEHPESWHAFDEGVFEAHWVEGRDIGDGDVLADIAVDVGLEGEEIRTALDDESLRAHLRDRFEAAHRRGVTGVPTFVYDEYAARGAVPPEHLARLVEGP